jgi:hypothetical protein
MFAWPVIPHELMGKINPFKSVIRALASFRVLERMAACHPIAEIQTGTLPDCDAALGRISAQKAAREAHQNEQALARTRLRLSRRPIFDASGKPHFWD